LAEFEPLLAVFAGLGLELPLIQEIMRWDMAVLRESPWYEQILQEGRQEGKQEGVQEGILETLVDTLEFRFGSVPIDLRDQLQTRNAEQLRSLHREALKCQDLDTFRTLLDA
jgi:predicted transposase YdaD